ncbi:MAG: hypothetical protein LBK71_10250 [Verrucomicrobiales bacterium]|jgi:hypothetical protein|nr:hypothetical protein [Verrucomicrobiales bacterium]
MGAVRNKLLALDTNVLITSDRHLLNITDQHLPALHIALTESGLDTVSQMSPRSFLRILEHCKLR